MRDESLVVAPEMSLTWLAAALAGFAEAADWQRWADSRILRCEKVPYWIYDLSLATGLQDLWTVTRQAMYEIDLKKVDACNFSPGVLGFYFIRYRLGRISLPQLLKWAGQESDRGFGGPGPEFFYAILNRLEAGQVSLEEAERQAALKLSREAEDAAARWNEMMPDEPLRLT